MLTRIETRFAVLLKGIAETTGKISAIQDKHGTILGAVDTSREPQAAAETSFPPPIASLMKNGLKLLEEGQYAQARQAYAEACLEAEEQTCTSAACPHRSPRHTSPPTPSESEKGSA